MLHSLQMFSVQLVHMCHLRQYCLTCAWALQIAAPLAVIGGHTKAVSYVRWVGSSQVISASTDNTLKLWDVADAASSEGDCAPITSFTGEKVAVTCGQCLAVPWTPQTC